MAHSREGKHFRDRKDAGWDPVTTTDPVPLMLMLATGRTASGAVPRPRDVMRVAEDILGSTARRNLAREHLKGGWQRAREVGFTALRAVGERGIGPAWDEIVRWAHCRPDGGAEMNDTDEAACMELAEVPDANLGAVLTEITLGSQGTRQALDPVLAFVCRQAIQNGLGKEVFAATTAEAAA